MNTENQLPLETILVITDITHSGSYALRYAKRIAELHGSKLVVVHAIDPAGYAFPEGIPESVADDQRALHVLKQIEKEIQEQGIQIHSIVESEMIYERILQTARDHHADLIVLDTRAIARIGRNALGTVARCLLAAAPCPSSRFRQRQVQILSLLVAGDMFSWPLTFPLPPYAASITRNPLQADCSLSFTQRMTRQTMVNTIWKSYGMAGRLLGLSHVVTRYG